MDHLEGGGQNGAMQPYGRDIANESKDDGKQPEGGESAPLKTNDLPNRTGHQETGTTTNEDAKVTRGKGQGVRDERRRGQCSL